MSSVLKGGERVEQLLVGVAIVLSQKKGHNTTHLSRPFSRQLAGERRSSACYDRPTESPAGWSLSLARPKSTPKSSLAKPQQPAKKKEVREQAQKLEKSATRVLPAFPELYSLPILYN